MITLSEQKSRQRREMREPGVAPWLVTKLCPSPLPPPRVTHATATVRSGDVPVNALDPKEGPGHFPHTPL